MSFELIDYSRPAGAVIEPGDRNYKLSCNWKAMFIGGGIGEGTGSGALCPP